MSSMLRVAGAVLLSVALLPVGSDAQPVPGTCLQQDPMLVSPGTPPDPAHAGTLLCVPSAGWNGQLVVFAPGYVPPQLPLDFHQVTTRDGVSLPLLVQSLGYAFATTTYRKNGLVVLDGVDDVRRLVDKFVAKIGPPSRIHVTGLSEGGLVATLLAERFPSMFASTLAACGPIGSFRDQINYVGDFRALFDYFFPGVALPGSPVSMPLAAGYVYDAAIVPAIDAALRADRPKALELMRVARVAHNPADFETVVRAAINLLRYNVMGLPDAQAVLAGNPYGNRGRFYFGSSNDLRLNLFVKRYQAAPSALAAMTAYETDGDLSIPLVTIHTTGDDVVPFAHELLYLPKVDTTDRGLFLPVPIARYGHCNFTATEIALAFLFTANLP